MSIFPGREKQFVFGGGPKTIYCKVQKIIEKFRIPVQWSAASFFSLQIYVVSVLQLRANIA